MIPAIIHLPEGSALDENVLDLLVTNHHARGGGIHSIILGTRTAVLRARNRDMLQTGFVLGVVGLATAFFLFLFLATRSTYAYPAFAALLLCLLMRTASSGAVLEQWFGNGWTDKRLLLEYFSGISLTPPAFFWFLFFLFPNLRLARADSPAEQWTRLFFLGGGGILTTVGIALSVWFVWCGDATVYGVHQPELVVGFLAPSIVFVLLTIVVCVLRRLPGSRSILCGTLALSAAAALDAVSVMHGDVSSLYVPLGTTVLVLAFCIAPAQQFQRLHRRAVASGVVLESTNKELRKRERSKAEFLAAYSRTLVEPLQVMADAALLRAQDDPSRENWLWVEQTQAAIAPLQRLEQWSRLQSNESVPVPLGVAATLGVGAQILGSVTGILPSLDVPPSLPPVRGRPELMQLLFGELAENLHRHAEPHLISIAARLEGTAVRVSILAQGHSCSLPEKHLLREFRSGHSSGSGMGVGLAIITRVIELHGGQLRVTNSCHGDQESTEYTFSLRTARHTRQQHLALLEKSYDFFCSEMGARKF